MNFFDNQYLLPVVLGNDDETLKVARILRKRHFEVHIFSNELAFSHRIRLKYHNTRNTANWLLNIKLSDFIAILHESYTPILIYSQSYEKDFIKQYFSELEKRYVIMSAKTALNYLVEG